MTGAGYGLRAGSAWASRLAADRRLRAGDPAARRALLARAERFAQVLDLAVAIPGTGRRVGLDALLGLAPAVGDAIGAALGGIVVADAWRNGVPAAVVARMITNLAVDAAIGSVPIVGDVADVFFQPHRRNLDLLRRHLGPRADR